MQLTPVKLALCGPSDVSKEILIAKEAVQKWNQLHSEARGLWVKPQHWTTDLYPDLADRAQAVPNRQIIDKSRIIVAIFWSRFGTPTGVADSGTQEEILRASTLGRKVMVYFSDIEPKPPNADTRQMEMLWEFRQTLRNRGICWTFQSRDRFRRLFEDHLALVLNAFEPKISRPKSARKKLPVITQKANARTGNVFQVVGDGNKFYAKPPVEKIIKERRPESVTAEQENQIGEWIRDLAQGEITMTQSKAFATWGARFKNRFKLGHREDLPAANMPDAEEWYRTQKAIQGEGWESNAPDLYRNRLISTIKAGMGEMGLKNETYYPALSERLKMKKPITHLPDLTTANLKRIRDAVRADVKKFRVERS